MGGGGGGGGDSGAPDPRKQMQHRAPIGEMPPNLANVVLELAILDRSVGVCGELGVLAQLRKIILKEYRLLGNRYSKLKGQFEQALKLFKKAEQDVEEGVGGRRQGGQGVKTREGNCGQQLLPTRPRQSICWGRCGGLGRRQKNAAYLSPPSPRCPPAPFPPLGNGR